MLKEKLQAIKNFMFWLNTKSIQPIALLQSASPFASSELPHFLTVDLPIVFQAFASIGV